MDESRTGCGVDVDKWRPVVLLPILLTWWRRSTSFLRSWDDQAVTCRPQRLMHKL